MSIKNAPSGTIRAALRYPDFRWLVSGLAVSQIGDYLYNLALVVLGAQGYGYMFAAIGTGGLLGTALAGRVSRLKSRPVLAAALAVAGLPTLLLAVVRSQPWRTRYPLARVGR